MASRSKSVTSDGLARFRLAAPPAGLLPALRRSSPLLRKAYLRLGGRNAVLQRRSCALTAPMQAHPASPSIDLRHPAPALTRTAVVTLTVTLAATAHVTLDAARPESGSRVEGNEVEEVEDPPIPSSQGDTRAACPGDKRACASEAGACRGQAEHVSEAQPVRGTGEHLSAKPEESLDHARRRGSLSPVHASYSINTRSAWELTGVFRVTTRNFP